VKAKEIANFVEMLIPTIANKNLKHSKYFFQFTKEVLIETLDKCEFTAPAIKLTQLIIDNSTKKESEQIINALMRNTHEINAYVLILLTMSEKYFSGSHFLEIIKKIEGMKEEMLKIDEVSLSNFLIVCANKSRKSHEIILRFLFFLINLKNVSLFSFVS
jgi:hypothetical protein